MSTCTVPPAAVRSGMSMSTWASGLEALPGIWVRATADMLSCNASGTTSFSCRRCFICRERHSLCVLHRALVQLSKVKCSHG